jgi:hypothetical protein
LFFAPLLFGSNIYRQQATTFSALARREWEYEVNESQIPTKTFILENCKMSTVHPIKAVDVSCTVIPGCTSRAATTVLLDIYE